MKPTFTISPVATVRKDDKQTVIEVNEEFGEALLGLDGFSHIIVCYWFDQNDTTEKRNILQVHPMKNKDKPLTGVFATHSPVRPNLLALTYCIIQKIEGLKIYIDEIDAFDQSPVIDIKPFIPEKKIEPEKVTVPEWVEHRNR
jgi:tRNA-Thr(GGU) m(6)t(6)A37 methyltransferase TsaA